MEEEREMRKGEAGDRDLYLEKEMRKWSSHQFNPHEGGQSS